MPAAQQMLKLQKKGDAALPTKKKKEQCNLITT
jgi:hypothetical protein